MADYSKIKKVLKEQQQSPQYEKLKKIEKEKVLSAAYSEIKSNLEKIESENYSKISQKKSINKIDNNYSSVKSKNITKSIETYSNKNISLPKKENLVYGISNKMAISTSLENNSNSIFKDMNKPDLFSNQFDVLFIVHKNIESTANKNTIEENLSSKLDFFDKLLNSEILSGRISSIEIPARSRKTTSFNVNGNSYDTPSDIVETSGKSKFTITGDENLYFVDIFNELSGTSLGSFFSKGSIIYDLLGEAAITDILKTHKEQLSLIENKRDDENYKKYLEFIETRDNEINTLILEKIENFSAAAKNTAATVLEESTQKNLTMSEVQNKLTDESKKAQELLKSDKDFIESEKQKNNISFFLAAKESNKIDSDIKKLNKEILELKSAIATSIKEQNKKFEDMYNKSINFKYDTQISELNEKTNEKIKNLGVTDKEEQLDYITSLISRNIMFKYRESNENIKDLSGKMDIIVTKVTPGETFMSFPNFKNKEQFIFEDVKILGTSDPIKFSRESASTQSFSYDFIYKKFYKKAEFNISKGWISKNIEKNIDKFINNGTYSSNSKETTNL